MIKKKVICFILNTFFKRYVDSKVSDAIRRNNEKWKQKIIANPDIHKEFFLRDSTEKELRRQLYFGTGTPVRLPNPESVYRYFNLSN